MKNKYLNNDERIKFLLYKIKNNQATIKEKKEYIDLLYEEGYIDNIEYSKYKKELNSGNLTIGETLIGVGLAVLLGALISELFKSK